MANNGGGTSLGGLVARMSAAITGRLYAPPKSTISGNDSTAHWPSALQPIQPISPPGSQPLGFSFWQGVNQDITPRLDAPITFYDLRNLATYPLARVCIENLKDVLCNTPWKIQLKRPANEPIAEWKSRQEKDQNIPRLTAFFEYPDGETPWADWVRPVIEDMAVIDAASIIVQRTLSGKVVALQHTDGANILRLITDQGFTPKDPNPAYTQLWEGIPYLLMTTKQLIYRPSNIVYRNNYSSKIYGMSMTEQGAQEIAVGQDRLNFVQAFYKDGITGGIIHVVPAGIPPAQVSENMQAQNSIMAGNLGQRRKWNVTQGYYEASDAHQDQIIQTKEPILADVFDDLHIRKIAFTYGVSAQRLLKAMNRASAESGQDSAEKEGTMPRLKWLKGTMDHTLQIQMEMANYEFIFDTDDELDATKQQVVDVAYVNSGIKTRDEVRTDRGWVPFNIPETQQPTVTIATGVTPLEGSIDRVEQAAADASTVANRPPPKPVIAGGGAGKAALSVIDRTRY